MFSPSLLTPNIGSLNYAILCLHTRWNAAAIEQLMGPQETTTYITMLRDPVSVFESSWEFYQMSRQYGMTLGKGRSKK